MIRKTRPIVIPSSFLLLVIVLGLPACAGSAQDRTVRSPLATLEAEREAVLAADSFDEVLAYVPAEAAGYVGQMSDDQKEAALATWTEPLDRANELFERGDSEADSEGREIVRSAWTEFQIAASSGGDAVDRSGDSVTGGAT